MDIVSDYLTRLYYGELRYTSPSEQDGGRSGTEMAS